MPLSNKLSHALIAVYGDNEAQDIADAISLYLPDREIRLLSPVDKETLAQAAQNSVLVFVGIHGAEDPNLEIGRFLQDNRMVVADVIAFCLKDFGISDMEVMSHGFDNCVSLEDTKIIEFKKYLASKIAKGTRRLASIIQEEEFQRLNDALSISPVSMIIFDSDKRAVFVSDHYFRAYPKIAPRLIRGLRIYDAFEMMITEEGIQPDDPRYEKIRQFWYNLDENVEFTLDNGVTYRLKSTILPKDRGTVITGQNISEYRKKKPQQKSNQEE